MIAILNVILLAFTFGLVELAEIDTSYLYSNNAEVEDLNDLTLNEFFVDNQLIYNADFTIDTDSDGTADGWIEYTASNDILIDGVQYVYYDINEFPNTTNSFSQTSGSVNLDIDDFVYFRYDIRTDDYQPTNLKAYPSGNFIKTGNDNGLNTRIIQMTHIVNNFYFNTYNNVDEQYFYIDYFYAYNLTELGITQTVLELDALYSLFLENQEREEPFSATINEIDLTDIMILIVSASVWYVGFKFIKEVI